MGYKELISSQLEAVYRKGIANRILQFMQKIRNEYDEGQARRWAMELLQNGRDVTYPESQLKAKFELTDDRLVYSHTGRPFRVKDILSIIYQVSSKLPGEESIGRFGTGFMSTYQLCERVQLDGVLKDEAEGYCPFQVMLDRTGTDAADIFEKIRESVQQIYDATEVLPEEDFNREDYNTKFTYYLETPLNKQTAQIGMEDMKENVLYVLLFSEKLKEITLVQNLGGMQSEISYIRDADVELSGNIRCLSILEKNKQIGESKEHRMLYLTENKVILAVEMDENNHILPISKKTPRLFVDFPLIGAENFPFPVVVNSIRLEPNEPRSGIALSDNINSKDSVQNKEVMLEAVALYGKLFHYAVEQEYTGLEHMIFIPKWVENKEQSETWVRCHLYKGVFSKISTVPFVETNDGKRALSGYGVLLVPGIGTEEGEGIRELLIPLKSYYVPVDSVAWPEVLAGYEMLRDKIMGLPELLERAQSLLKYNLNETKMLPLTWCQKLYDLAMKNGEQALRIRSGQVAIFPNQCEGDWKGRSLFTASQIKKDPGIPEVIKDVSEELDRLNSTENEPIRIRKNLLHREFQAQEEVAEYEQSRLYEYIRRRSNRGFTVVSYNMYWSSYEAAWQKAWELLLSCGEDEELYRLYEDTADHELRPYQKEEGLPPDLFRNSYFCICTKLLEWVQKQEVLENVRQKLGLETANKQLYDWMNRMLKKTMCYRTESDVFTYRVFPNQQGKLVKRQEGGGFWDDYTVLKQDKTKTEELKEILAVFEDLNAANNLYRELLDKNIHLESCSLQIVTDDVVAGKLNHVVQQLLSEHNISDVKEEYQDACTRLLAFLQEEPESAKRNFPSFCTEEAQMRLLAPKAAVRIQRQAKQMQQLFSQLGVASPEEVMELIEQARMQNAQRKENLDEVLWDGETSLDADWVFSSEDERNQMIRFIGTAGEKYAFEEICKSFADWTEEEKRDNYAVYALPEGNLRVVIDYPDTENYKQSGWDIRIAFDGMVKKCYYVEVKTHTTKSIVRNQMALSPMQILKAVQEGDHYAVMMVDYDRTQGGCVAANIYRNPIKLFSSGKIKNLMDKYVFSVS